MYDTDSDKELNGDFGMEYHDNDIDTDDEEHLPRAKVRPIKNNKNNKPTSLTVNETSLKSTQTKETNKEDKDNTRDTIYNK